MEVKLDTAALPQPEFTSDFNLPSGKHAQIRKGVGRDLVQAMKNAGPDADVMTITYALVAQLTLIDGHPIVLEDVLDMDLTDLNKLQTDPNFRAPA
ncbi:MAG TPA: hypothetical protein VMV27_01875 [Candidatus Binataceae bacterium]|nr:hypothetical protein [Candidatus Binataceae bacterium]